MTKALGVIPVLAVALIVGMTSIRPNTDDPAWSPFTELQRPRAYAHAVTLPTGEILVVGGLDPSDPAVTNATSEIVDPLARASLVLPDALLGRVRQSVTLDTRERVVMAGGVVREHERWVPVRRVDVFDVKTRRWSAGADMRLGRSDHAAVALEDGRVAVFGGNYETTLLSTVEIYDARTGTWSDAAPMPGPRTQHTAVRLADGRVLIAGGIAADGAPTDSTFLYDPATDRWSHGPRMGMRRLQQATVLLPNGDVLIVGGDGDAGSSSEVFVAKEGRFVRSGQLAEARLVAQAAALPDGRVVVAGGLPPAMAAYHPLRSVEMWDPRSGTWSPLRPLAAGRAWGTLVRSRGALFLVSGNGDGEEPFRSIERLLIE